MINWEYIEFFDEHEFTCHCGCGQTKMDMNFIYALVALRRRYRKPIIITSGYRCPEHNVKVSFTGRDGPHTTGKAADINVNRTDAFELLRAAFELNFLGIGIKQKGDGRFIHLDTILDASTRPTIWSY